MYHFNPQERVFLLSLCCVLFLGAALRLLIKVYPNIHNIINVMESERFYPKVNINTASKDALVHLPYIGEYTAERIMAYRKRNGAFHTLEELKNVKGSRDKNFERFKPYLAIP